ncbi:hypothetical protein LBMAG56_34380 [Verrucomicrobiota bacterium]|nr:hypothetical protein LBMAG56_34380 [Verrucomicrobiota bacterium]
MNRKQLLILVVLLAVIGGAGLVYLKKDNAEYASSGGTLGQKLLETFQINDVAQVVLKQDKQTVSLVKQDDLWRVKERQDYPANFSTIGDLIRKAAELKVVQSEQIGASQLERMELVEPGKGAAGSGTLVEFKDKGGKTIRSMMLGKKQVKKSESPSPFGGGDFPVGRWITTSSKPGVAALVSETFTEAEPKAEQWLDKEFFKVEKVKSVSLTSTNATNSWRVSRETEAGEWKLADPRAGEVLDTNKVSSLGSVLASPSFNDVVAADAKPEDTGLNTPSVVKIETFDGFTYTAKVGKKTSDEASLHFSLAVTADLPKARTPGKDEKPEDKEKLDKEFAEKTKKLEEKLAQEKKFEKYTYLVSKWSVDSALKDRTELLVEKKEPTKPDDTKPELKLPSGLTPPPPPPTPPAFPPIPPAPTVLPKPPAPKLETNPVPKVEVKPAPPAPPAPKAEVSPAPKVEIKPAPKPEEKK